MSAPPGQYTLYYSLPSPLAEEVTGHEQAFNDIVDALSAAWTISQRGGTPTHLLHDNAWLFSGEDLKEVLEVVSARGAQHGAALPEVVRTVLPDVLVKQLAKTVHFAHEHFGAVAVYRDLLEELYAAADQAIQKKDLELLYKITGVMTFSYVPSERDVRQWGKDFLQAYRRDAGWLHDTKVALKKIEAAAKQLEAVDGSRNAELKARILKTAEDGLITHI